MIFSFKEAGGFHEPIWRHAWEVEGAIVWCLVSLIEAYLFALDFLAWPLFLVLFCLALGFSLFNLTRAYRVWAARAQLDGEALAFLPIEALFEWVKKSKGRELWLGWGFSWTPEHAQRLFDLSERDIERLRLTATMKKVFHFKKGLSRESVGVGYLHGIGAKESAITPHLKSLGGGTLVVGTTQAGKGIMLNFLVSQAIFRGDIVIVIDPKSSKRLRQTVLKATEVAGRFEALEFHPAFPERGIRLDPMGSFSRSTELAGRIESVMPIDNAGAFKAFAWSAVNVVVSAMLYNEERPTLMKLRTTILEGIDPLLEKSLDRHFERYAPFSQEAIEELQRRYSAQFKLEHAPSLLAKVEYYERVVGKDHPEPVIALELQVFRHNRDHYQKITASLEPVLSMLTSGSLAKSLSPDTMDLEDTRPIMTMEKVIEGGHVLYLGLDALPDATVASALGAILLSDLTALAGKRYNTEESGINARRVSLFVDETANVINQPMIELLNKGMEAGVHVTAAMQTIADLSAKLGSEAKARMALGNFNNVIALRSKDLATQSFIVESFGKTTLWQTDGSQTTSAASTILPDFHTSVSRRKSGLRETLVAPDMLGKLPNGEYFAAIAGGKLFKGRVPILRFEEGQS